MRERKEKTNGKEEEEKGRVEALKLSHSEKVCFSLSFSSRFLFISHFLFLSDLLFSLSLSLSLPLSLFSLLCDVT